MPSTKLLTVFINCVLVISIVFILLISVPWTNNPPLIPYYASIIIFWLFLLLRFFLTQWQKEHIVTYKSYIGSDNKVKKKIIMPDKNSLRKLLGSWLTPAYISGLLILILLFLLNHGLLFFSAYLTDYIPWLFRGDAIQNYPEANYLLIGCLAGVLFLALAVVAQTKEIKENNKTYSMQNLIINAHSKVSLEDLHIHLDADDTLFLSLNKLEYVLHAKTVPAIRLARSKTMIKVVLSLKVTGTIPVTDFYAKRLSLLIGDINIECENNQQQFYPLYAENNIYTLAFYIYFNNAERRKLVERFSVSSGLRMYYCFIIKNSVGVITELYGTSLYEKNNKSTKIAKYKPKDVKGNQYFYL